MYHRMLKGNVKRSENAISCSADEHPLLVVSLSAHLSKVGAEGVFDDIVRNLGESTSSVSTYA